MKWISHDSAALAWLGIVLFIFLYVLAFDLWAHFSDHLTMTGQFRNWLRDPVAGPIIFGLWVAVIAALSYHFLIRPK